MAFSAVASDIPERLTEPKGEHVYLPDPDKLFEDSAATTPASVGGPVGAWEDQSGNHTATQSTTANKPTLRQDANGQFYLEFVPNEDFLETSVTTTNATKASTIPGVGAFSAQVTPGNKSRSNARLQSTTAGAIVKEGSLTDSHRTSLANAIDQRGKDVADPVTSFEDYFREEPLTDYNAHAQDTSQVTDMRRMFQSTSVSDLSGLSGWDTSQVTDMRGMFRDTSVSDLSPLSGWDTSQVTNMRLMFRDTSVSDLSPLSGWDTSQVTDMRVMFFRTSVSDLSPLSGWDVGSLIQANGFAEGAPLDDVPTGDMLDGWTDGSPNTAADLQSGVTLGISNADYSQMDTGGQDAVDALCSNRGWTINATNAPADCS